MINADKARELAKEKNSGELARFLEAVEEKIIATTNKGEYTCFMDIDNYNYFSISYAPEILQNLGYRASFETDYTQQSTYLMVKW